LSVPYLQQIARQYLVRDNLSTMYLRVPEPTATTSTINQPVTSGTSPVNPTSAGSHP
jgi:hypothetical protein